MKIINSYVPPSKSPLVLPSPDAPYDLNFRYPIRELESDKIKLTPLIPSIHGKGLSEAIKLHPELLRYLPWSPSTLANDYDAHYEILVRSNPAWCVLCRIHAFLLSSSHSADPPCAAIAVGSALAGAIGYLNAAPECASVEIGYAIVLPAYQRTFVSTHAIGLLLKYALEPPSSGGLGLRRVQWQAHANNAPSIRAAQRMGLKWEGVTRWQRPWLADKEGAIDGRTGDALYPVAGRHSAMLAMCWDDWEDSGRELVRKLMDRIL